MDKDLKNRTPAELEQIVEAAGQKKYLAGYIFSFIHTKDAFEISQLSTLSKEFRNKLIEDGYYISGLNVARKLEDPDGTIKYLFELVDGLAVEAVLIFDEKRRTLCVSTQVGCAMGCEFCATAGIKFKRNLTAGEIADEVNAVIRDGHKVSNVVYMGMGEPLLNYGNVVRSVRILNDARGRGIGIRHLTISTSAIIPGIERLANEDVQPRLAVSLNAADDELRSKLMPINRKYPLRELMKVLRVYQLKTKNRITFEYVLIKGVNDSKGCALKLVRLIENIKCNVNLIEFNSHSGCSYSASTKKDIERFSQILESAGIETTVRFKMGQSIKAACGQLGADWK